MNKFAKKLIGLACICPTLVAGLKHHEGKIQKSLTHSKSGRGTLPRPSPRSRAERVRSAEKDLAGKSGRRWSG